MNSLNENLNSNIVSSLNDQELEMQQAEATLNASKFSLYYAQGETITAAQKLKIATDQYYHQQLTYKEAVVDSDFSTNVLSSANSSKDYVDQSVSNTSVAAANVQIATNAIVKLAGDIGNAFNIVDAGDYGTEIYNQAKYANEVISDTAYNAEKASEIGMNASTDIAEVPSTTLAAKAQATDDSMKSLLTAVDTDFQAKSAEMEADNEALATANTEEKAAEGTIEQNNVNYAAVSDAYDMSNEELNINLQVTIPNPEANTGEFIVSFDPYESPFPQPTEAGIPINENYPVEEYYIMIVKYDKSSIFSTSNAEGLIQENQVIDEGPQEGKNRYWKLDPTERVVRLMPVDVLDVNILSPYSALDNDYMQSLYLDEMVDSDGEPLEKGVNYVAFVLATLTNEYKKLINTYDDYMTAPTKKFNITTYLHAVDHNNIFVLNPTEGEKEVSLIDVTGSTEIGDIDISYKLSETETITIKDGKLTFDTEVSGDLDANVEIGPVDLNVNVDVNFGDVEEIPLDETKQLVVFVTPDWINVGIEKEYRALFLPNDLETINNLLTVDDLDEILKITENHDALVFKWAQQLREIINEMEENEQLILDSESEYDEIKLEISNSTKKPKKSITERMEELENIIESLKNIKSEIELRYVEVKEEIIRLLAALNDRNEVPKFFFDLTIAQKVPFGSYTPITEQNKISVPGFDIWCFQIEASTTDNFGNRLLLGKEYIPSVLTVADFDSYSENQRYTNAYSEITQSGIFTYETFPK